MSKKKLNQVLPSPFDNRDYPVSAVMDFSAKASQVPADFEVWQPPIEDQGSTGNCVAQVCANIMECIDYQETNTHDDYSVGFVYGSEYNTIQTAGMYPREACKILLKEGDIYRSLWECLEENPSCRNKRSKIPDSVRSRAKKISAYVRLQSKEEIKAFIYKYRLPVLIVAKAADYEYGENLSGYHATTCYGWESRESFYKTHDITEDYRELKYTNSWGEWLWYAPDFTGRGNISFDKITEAWGFVPMENKKLTDINGHWAEQDITDGQALGLFNGYEDNTFQPNKEVTRAEMATITMREHRLQEQEIKRLERRLEVLEKILRV